MNKEYIASLEKTIERKQAEVKQMEADGVKYQKIGLLREEIYRKQRTLAKAKADMKKRRR